MIPIATPDEPGAFDAECRQPGKTWLAANGTSDPHKNPLWGAFTSQLRAAFGNRCGFLAMYVPQGTVDHWVSIKSDRDLAYEWSNYRFVAGPVNSAKKPKWEGKLIDPFEVMNGWFEILLPSLQLVVTGPLDDATRERAEFTLQKLRLKDGETVIRLRQEWLAMYECGKLPIAGLHDMAPLLARAVAKRDGLPDPSTPDSQSGGHLLRTGSLIGGIVLAGVAVASVARSCLTSGHSP